MHIRVYETQNESLLPVSRPICILSTFLKATNPLALFEEVGGISHSPYLDLKRLNLDHVTMRSESSVSGARLGVRSRAFQLALR